MLLEGIVLLKLKDVDAHYGLSHVLYRVSFTVEMSETVSLLGRNGAGKTTTLGTVMGVHREAEGSITFENEELIGIPAYKILQKGISLVPEGRQIFSTLTVYENLKMGFIGKRNNRLDWTFKNYLEMVFMLFPPLKERLGNKGRQLSGGEQQMLAVARALGCRPKLLMLDEPTEGLAPEYVNRISETILELQKKNVAMLLVTQDTKLAMNVSKRILFIEKGRISYEGTSQDVAQHPEVRLRYLGV
jgi:branched-chain amino acid transport system ATP-binding protein